MVLALVKVAKHNQSRIPDVSHPPSRPLFRKALLMTRTFTLAAAMTALALSPAASANDVAEVVAEGTPVKLISFDGEQRLLQSSNRLRIWRSHLSYTLSVDAEGKVTGCELTEPFRRKYISVQLCKLLSASHTFEPARDADNNAVAGSYTNRISYLELREKY